MNPPTPIALMEHDHVKLSRQIEALHRELRALAAASAPGGAMADDLVQALVALSEDLFEHFAREEEALFPFLLTRAPDLRDEVAALVEGHDRICGAASRLLALRDRPPSAGTIALAVSLFQRLVDVYAAHSGRELELLGTLAQRLDEADQAELAVLVSDGKHAG